MQYSLAALVLAGLAAANPFPSAVTSAIAPSSSSSADCKSTVDGTFEIQVVNVTSTKRSMEKRQSTALVLTLENGILKDAKGRTGYIAANSQFQFDGPPQAGALITSGWSVCSNGTLALGAEAEFFQCLSGTFYNLYDKSTGAQCNNVYIQTINGGGSASQASDGQVTATPVESQMTDGQITGVPVTQITDGQIQGPTGAPVSQITDGQPQAPTSAAVVSQITDGQPQAPTSGAVVSQITDGQPQAPTSAAVVSQITDGQPQAPTSAAVVSQITDGQPQVPTSAAVVSQISDGQPQAPTNGTVASATATVQPYTGAAAIPTMRSELFGLAAGVLAVAML